MANITALTGNMGELISRNMDNRVYCSTVTTILNNIVSFNIKDSFSGQNFGYGYGFFIILSILTGPFYWSGNDLGFSTSLMMVNIVGAVLIVCLSINLYSKLRDMIGDSSFSKGRVCELLLVSLFLCVLPSLNYVLRTPRPEVWQTVFLLISIISYIKYHESHKAMHLIGTSICMGFAVGLKVSLAPVAFAFGLFIIFTSLKTKKFANIFIFCFISLVSCALFINPNLFVNPVDAMYFVLNEIKIAAGMLKLNQIADFNYCFPLQSRWNAIQAWVTYPYIKAYVGLPFLLIGIVSFILLIKCFSNNKIKLIFGGIIILHIINAVFLIVVSTTVSSFYLLSTIVPAIIVFFSCIFFLIERLQNKYSKYAFGAFSFIVIFQSGINILNFNRFDQMCFYRLSKNFETNINDYFAAQKAILDSELPKGSVLIDPEAVLPFNSFEWDYMPHGHQAAGADYYASRHPVSSLECIVKPFNLPDQDNMIAIGALCDILVLSKASAATPVSQKYINDYNFIRICENPSVIVLSRHPLPEHFTGNLSYYKWGWDNSQEHSDSYFTLNWSSDKWQGTGMGFPYYVSFKTANYVKLKFKLIKTQSASNLKTLRLSFFGLPISNKSDERNVWDYDIKNLVKEGDNEIIIPLNQFKKSSGRVYWGYLNQVAFGGQALGWTIKMNEISIE